MASPTITRIGPQYNEHILDYCWNKIQRQSPQPATLGDILYNTQQKIDFYNFWRNLPPQIELLEEELKL